MKLISKRNQLTLNPKVFRIDKFLKQMRKSTLINKLIREIIFTQPMINNKMKTSKFKL